MRSLFLVAVLPAFLTVACIDYEIDQLPQEDTENDVCEMVSSRYEGEPTEFSLSVGGVIAQNCTPATCLMWSTDLTPVIQVLQGDVRDSWVVGNSDTGGDGDDEPNWGAIFELEGTICYGDVPDCDPLLEGIQTWCWGECYDAATEISYLGTPLEDYVLDTETYRSKLTMFGFLLQDAPLDLLKGTLGDEDPSGHDFDENDMYGYWLAFPDSFSYTLEIATQPPFPNEFGGVMTRMGPSDYQYNQTVKSLLATKLNWSDDCGGQQNFAGQGGFGEPVLAMADYTEILMEAGTSEGTSGPSGHVLSRGFVRWNAEQSTEQEGAVAVPRPWGIASKYRYYAPNNPPTSANAWVSLDLVMDSGTVSGTVNWTGTLTQGSKTYEDFAFEVVGDVHIINPEQHPGRWIAIAILRSPVYTGNPNIDNLRVRVVMFNATRRLAVQRMPLGPAELPDGMFFRNAPGATLFTDELIRLTNPQWQ